MLRIGCHRLRQSLALPDRLRDRGCRELLLGLLSRHRLPLRSYLLLRLLLLRRAVDLHLLAALLEVLLRHRLTRLVSIVLRLDRHLLLGLRIAIA